MTDAAQDRAARRRREVFAACSELEDEGRPISITNVVAAIGGSNSTAAKYIKEWKAERFREAPASDPELFELTKAIRDQAMRLVEDKLEKARQQAQRAEEGAAEARQAAESAALRSEEAETARLEAESRADEATTRAQKAEEERSNAVGKMDGFRKAQELATKGMQKVTAELKEAVKAAALERQELIARISAVEDVSGVVVKGVRETSQASNAAVKVVERSVAELREIATEMLADAGKEFSAAAKTISEAATQTQEATIASAASATAEAIVGQIQSHREYIDNRITRLESAVLEHIEALGRTQRMQGEKILALERKRKRKRGKDE